MIKPEFEKGTWVEVTNSYHGNNGNRFMVGEILIEELFGASGEIVSEEGYIYETTTKVPNEPYENYWVAEKNIKQVKGP